MAKLRIRKSLSKKIGDKIESSVPDEYKQPGVVIKPEEKKKAPIPEWTPVSSDKVVPDKSIKVGSNKEEEQLYKSFEIQAGKPDHTYIESMLNANMDELKKAQGKINAIKEEVHAAERATRILTHINKSKASFDVKWLINKIGSMKSSPTSLDDLEQEIYNYVEIQMNKKRIE